MRSLELALQGAGKVLVAGLLFGAGLPVVYALAMRALTLGGTGSEGAAGDHAPAGHSTLGRVLAALLVLVVVGGVAVGLLLIVAGGFGKAVSFEHVLPTIVDKK